MKLALLFTLLYPLCTMGQLPNNTLVLEGASQDIVSTFDLIKISDTFGLDHFPPLRDEQYEIESDTFYEIKLPRYYFTEIIKILDPITLVEIDVNSTSFLDVLIARINLGEIDSVDISSKQLHLTIEDSNYCFEKIECFRIRNNKVNLLEIKVDPEYSMVCEIFDYLPIRKKDEYLITTCRTYNVELKRRASVNMMIYLKIN